MSPAESFPRMPRRRRLLAISVRALMVRIGRMTIDEIESARFNADDDTATQMDLKPGEDARSQWKRPARRRLVRISLAGGPAAVAHRRPHGRGPEDAVAGESARRMTFRPRRDRCVPREGPGRGSCEDRSASYPNGSAEALLALGTAVLAADGPVERHEPDVVMKSLDINLRVDGRIVDTRREFHRYRVEQVRATGSGSLPTGAQEVGPTVGT